MDPFILYSNNKSKGLENNNRHKLKNNWKRYNNWLELKNNKTKSVLEKKMPKNKNKDYKNNVNSN